MLFRQTVVEQQQTCPVIDRRGTVRRHELPTKQLPLAAPARFQHGHRSPCFDRTPDQREHLGVRKFTRQHIQFALGPVQPERPVSLVNGKVLQLPGRTFGDAGFPQGPEKRPVARHERRPHENLAHERIDERRMDTVAAEMPRPHEPAADGRQPLRQSLPETMSSRTHPYFFSMPASRPVEKAI